MTTALAIVLSLGSTAGAATCDAWGDADTTITVAGGPSESSGVAAARTRDGVWFTHDDRGGEPVLYAFRLDGTLEDTHLVSNASNTDWEDLAAAPCPDRGDCLYVGDIGNNDGSRADVTVYVVPEPRAGDARVRATHRYTAVYPGSAARDAEALTVHPCTGRITLVTRDADGRSEVYRFPANPSEGEVSTLELVATLTIEGLVDADRQVTAADQDVDGETFVLRTAGQVLLWDTDPEQPDAHWGDTPEVLAIPGAADGEGVAIGLDGRLVSTSEGQPMPVTVVPCASLQPGEPCAFPQTGGCGCATSPTQAGWLIVLLGLGVAMGRRTDAAATTDGR